MANGDAKITLATTPFRITAYKDHAKGKKKTSIWYQGIAPWTEMIDFTLSIARRFYLSVGGSSEVSGLRMNLVALLWIDSTWLILLFVCGPQT